MIRIHWAVMGLSAIVLTGTLGLACDSGETVNPSGSTSSTTTTSSSSGGGSGGQGGTGGGAVACTMASDCTNLQATYCGTPDCVMGQCEIAPMNEGDLVPPGSDVYGDCMDAEMCVMGLPTAAINTNDIYNDGKECTVDACSAGGTPTHDNVPAGDPCVLGPNLMGICDGSGTCVECIDDTQCGADFCQNGACVPSHCTNMMTDMGETGTDCGGAECNDCPDGEACNTPPDCLSQICSGGPKACQPATCSDSVLNGDETDFDCGGSTCPKCSDTLRCLLPADCESGVCMDLVCQAPTCTDGVQNGDEEGVDCGGTTCSACAMP